MGFKTWGKLFLSAVSWETKLAIFYQGSPENFQQLKPNLFRADLNLGTGSGSACFADL